MPEKEPLFGGSESVAWMIALGGIALEIFIATLDFWVDIPHYTLVLDDEGFHLEKGAGR